MNDALGYAAVRQLTYPQKSSVFRRIVGFGSTVAKATAAATIVLAEYQALWDEMQAAPEGGASRSQQRRVKMLRWLWYLTIWIVGGLIVAVVGLWSVTLTDKTGAEVVGRWGGLLLAAVVVFGLAGRTPYRRSATGKFWRTLALLGLVHFAFFGWLMWSVPKWYGAWWGFVIPLEWALITAALRRAASSDQ